MTDNNLDSIMGDFVAEVDSLIDEVQPISPHKSLLVHHVGGDPNDRVVIGTSVKGKGGNTEGLEVKEIRDTDGFKTTIYGSKPKPLLKKVGECLVKPFKTHEF